MLLSIILTIPSVFSFMVKCQGLLVLYYCNILILYYTVLLYFVSRLLISLHALNLYMTSSSPTPPLQFHLQQSCAILLFNIECRLHHSIIILNNNNNKKTVGIRIDGGLKFLPSFYSLLLTYNIKLMYCFMFYLRLYYHS